MSAWITSIALFLFQLPTVTLNSQAEKKISSLYSPITKIIFRRGISNTMKGRQQSLHCVSGYRWAQRLPWRNNPLTTCRHETGVRQLQLLHCWVTNLSLSTVFPPRNDTTVFLVLVIMLVKIIFNVNWRWWKLMTIDWQWRILGGGKFSDNFFSTNLSEAPRKTIQKNVWIKMTKLTKTYLKGITKNLEKMSKRDDNGKKLKNKMEIKNGKKL